MWTIYMHTHVASGRRYIGQTKLTVARRWKGHVAAARLVRAKWARFANAIRKYGPEAFVHRVLELCASQAAADEAEVAWIDSFSTTIPEYGFNIKRAGQGDNSRSWSDPKLRASRAAAIGLGLRARYAADASLRGRIQTKRLATMAKKNAERTHFTCKVHGPIPVGDCYSKTSNGFTSYECPTCVLAAQKAKRDAYRAEHPLVAPTMFRCAVHGDIPFDDCYKRKLADGRVWHRCKACTLEKNRGRPLLPPKTDECVKCGKSDRFPTKDGRRGDCRFCHHERARLKREARPKRELGTAQAPRVDTSDRPSDPCGKCGSTRRTKPKKNQRLGDCLDCRSARDRAKRAAAREALTPPPADAILH